jgi:hypothetical protein
MTENNPASDEEAPVEETEAAPEAFANRAARRAKGRSTAKPEVFSKGQRPIGRGSVQSPRQYGNRRSG